MNYRADLLVVDDEPVLLAAVRKICEAHGLSIDEAQSSDAGMTRLATGHYRMALTDLMLPGVGGLQVLQAIRNDWPDTPVVVITGHATQERIVESFQAGAFEVLPKPFDEPRLLAVVDRALQFGRLEASLQRSVGHAEFCEQRRALDLGPAELFSLGPNAWVSVEPDGPTRIGIAEGFHPLAGRIQEIELLATDDAAIQGKACASITTSDGLVHRVRAPISGRVLDINASWPRIGPEVDSLPARWIFSVLPTDLESELEKLTRR